MRLYFRLICPIRRHENCRINIEIECLREIVRPLAKFKGRGSRIDY